MKKSVLLITVVSLLLINVSHATLDQSRVPLDFRSDNGSGIAVNHENAGTLEVVGTEGVFVLVAKPPNPSGKNDPGAYQVIKKQSMINDVPMDENRLTGRKSDHRTERNGRLEGKIGRWHKAPEMSRMHYAHSGRGSTVRHVGGGSSHHVGGVLSHYVGNRNPAIETQRKPRTVTLEENEDTSHQENGLHDDSMLRKERKHEATVKVSKRTRARTGTTRKRGSCLHLGRCGNREEVKPRMSHPGGHVNETAVGDWVIIYKDVKLTNNFGRSMDASQLLRCQKGQPPEIHLPINSQLTLDTRGASLDQNAECNWRLKVLDGRGLMVHCYLQRDGGGHSHTSSTLTVIPGADENGPVKIERLDRLVPRGVWYFRSKEVMITFTAGRGLTEGSSFYKCDVLVK